jgi:putative ABC transport system substrate-binding protein
MIRRREFITLLGGAAAWPLAAGAQQGNRVRRIGVLMGYDENEPLVKSRPSALAQALAGLGWTDGRNARMDVRWASGDINRIRAIAQELVGLQPDIILANGTLETVASREAIARLVRIWARMRPIARSFKFCPCPLVGHAFTWHSSPVRR